MSRRKRTWAATAAVLLFGTIALAWLVLRPGQAPGLGDVGVWLDALDNGPSLEERIDGFEEQIRLHNLNPEAVVRLSEDYAVAAAAGENRVRVVELYVLPTGHPHAHELAGGEHSGQVPSFNLQTSGGDTGKEWNTVFFGTAPANVDRVVVDGFDAEGGQVIGRAWVLLIRDKDVQPAQLHWRFLDTEGNTVLRGTGLTPAGADRAGSSQTPSDTHTPKLDAAALSARILRSGAWQ